MHSESAELEGTHREQSSTPALHCTTPKGHSMSRSIVQMCQDGVYEKNLFQLKPV